jgi:hypothetical protein
MINDFGDVNYSQNCRNFYVLAILRLGFPTEDDNITSVHLRDSHTSVSPKIALQLPRFQLEIAISTPENGFRPAPAPEAVIYRAESKSFRLRASARSAFFREGRRYGKISREMETNCEFICGPPHSRFTFQLFQGRQTHFSSLLVLGSL